MTKNDDFKTGDTVYFLCERRIFKGIITACEGKDYFYIIRWGQCRYGPEGTEYQHVFKDFALAKSALISEINELQGEE